MLVRHGSAPWVEVGAAPAHTLSQARNSVAPVGMLAFGLPHRPPTAGSCRALMISCGIDSFVSVKSPSRHSPKAIVFEVPSVTMESLIGPEPSEPLKPPPNLKIPF